jgi:hypothetical protein
MIDQGFCFNAGEWNFPDAPLRGLYARNRVHEGVTGMASFAPWLERLERQMTERALDEITKQIPPGWYDDDFDALPRLSEQRRRRRPRVEELILEAKKSNRRLAGFPARAPVGQNPEIRARRRIHVPRRSHAHRLQLPAQRHAGIHTRAFRLARAKRRQRDAYTAERIAAKASLKTEFAALTDIDLTEQSDRNRFVDRTLRDAGVEPIPLSHFAVWVAKLKPMIQ